MSKEAAVRAMREARYARRSATAPLPAKPLKLVKPGAELPVAPPVVDTSAAELCGHRSMNGRTCTREQGHTAKSHRYG
ncbi:hypothetical protein [Nocardioides dilutus]